MNALYLILIALCFSVGIWATTLQDDASATSNPACVELKSDKPDDLKAEQHEEACSTDWTVKKLLAE
ncbi:MAG TPA: hypothetical protein DCQ26_08150 [Marinilabiliales bacterium]|jgi:hypothetical protein|nr:hypothetical protein [Salinivirgaceae bacterium]OFX42693.1 MAG: hypothetical protein A2W95_17075 [Bacteroidetes bacterium GWA2_40_14]OFX56884.1 MAG: hypothetical protein A2W84_17815 [Bacteroidetes bacterium GWC2_40_13]OFX73748.1 MAG: hypothetical protein A2W96_02400 [Bacteroidetes bacterium GWD2_40_43]OFX95023.1 MAG: hypothetical protein A2W97_16810 [Bacteroidetes bacterium GWE2_40_63]OFY17886.1 MAG: hypothetical protein A2W88_05715 [Bacteroidetes bacterium GWF2_40_13]OFZ29223.1 MAG: hypot